MHIENVNITLSVPSMGAALLSALASQLEAVEVTGASAAPPTAADKQALPAIGQPWPGIDGIYAGLSRGENGEPDAHLVLLNAKPDRDMEWADAIAWAEGLGDGVRLPTRFESALLYAHLQDQFETSRWHWSSTQYSSSHAWGQGFTDGLQLNDGKEFEARARAVRRLIL